MGAIYDLIIHLQHEGNSVNISGLSECLNHVKFEKFLVILFRSHPSHHHHF